MVNDEPFTTTEQVAELSKLDLPFSQNTLSFEFAALDFSDPASNQFQYRLVGYDRDWVKSGTRGFARYANLPPGNYTLEILAANSDGVWSTVPKSLFIRMRDTVWDNGKMPEKAYKTTGSGTSNMQMRAEKIGGTLEISRADGFEVVLKLKDIG